MVFKKDEWVLYKSKKLDETFKGQFRVTKVNENGTTLIRCENAKFDDLVSTNSLVKYNRSREEEEEE
jgi:hypothetical protein